MIYWLFFLNYWKGAENSSSTVHGSLIDGIESSEVTTSKADAGIRKPSDGLEDHENSDCFKFLLEKVMLFLPPAFIFSRLIKCGPVHGLLFFKFQHHESRNPSFFLQKKKKSAKCCFHQLICAGSY